jgi:hypothetical protein
MKYTVENPPENMRDVYFPYVEGLYVDGENAEEWGCTDTEIPHLVRLGLAHSSRESAIAHGDRMLRVDEIIEAARDVLEAHETHRDIKGTLVAEALFNLRRAIE